MSLFLRPLTSRLVRAWLIRKLDMSKDTTLTRLRLLKTCYHFGYGNFKFLQLKITVKLVTL